MVAAVAALVLSAGAAQAFQCPKLITQGREAAAKMDATDAKVKGALAQLDQAEALHKQAKHADAVKTANEALAALGVAK
ncbi:MAG: hypothetical protein A3E31_04420 [Candidatus Rokubacteria bacterium RIFCSPHIGHO2_12_FULL_73_22]|nr:MAG: hypothetical protein A3D33_02270 [Candidatus Rokubacteria bacterium RIFCSPHIGHO2_02_FULL_73_26]OGL03213.1 MAG: hypothetical protein A3E31_04420 [Candidatus Rokubacteria bacterium RIFCSPHIGHO2_12_FULL_73_22]OGL09283.1 MAG: hypothetical protein A3I14_03845 [Candidatus Rokubacteria bacterium RIFCSPLOWO2_02_FULL_73_56]OGL29128.1 MAG: hypothetical protein A3G44_06015 [Candidatus Rokubacteria bacterium RIFCSPLOWO2_12_FULL_73_47]